MTEFNYIKPEDRLEVLREARADIYNPTMQQLVKDEVQSEIWDAVQEMSASEKFEYIRKRLAHEEQVMKLLQKQYEEAIKHKTT